jgi:hypothetical protein
MPHAQACVRDDTGEDDFTIFHIATAKSQSQIASHISHEDVFG